jgi:alpha-mannosidase
LGNALFLHDDNPKNWDAWDVDADYRTSYVQVSELVSATVEMEGPLRAVVRFTRKFGSSTLEQRMVCDADSRVLRFETEIDWQEEHKFLKVAFPVAVRSRRAKHA